MEKQVCQKCKKKCEKVIKFLVYFLDGKPVFDNRCADCEKKFWTKFKEGIK